MLVIAAWYLAYEAVRAVSPTHVALAREHARSLLAMERWAHLAPEQVLNRYLSNVPWLASLAGYYYVTLHFAVTGIVLAWLYRRHPTAYRPARRVLIIASVTALVVYWFYPVMPPRLAMLGMDDTVVTAHIWWAGHATASGGFIDLYAALPSLHVGWAVWAAAALVYVHPHNRWWQLAWLYPLATSLVVLSTANHYLIDVVTGAALIGLAALAAELIVRGVLPRAWTRLQLAFLRRPFGRRARERT